MLKGPWACELGGIPEVNVTVQLPPPPNKNVINMKCRSDLWIRMHVKSSFPVRDGHGEVAATPHVLLGLHAEVGAVVEVLAILSPRDVCQLSTQVKPAELKWMYRAI